MRTGHLRAGSRNAGGHPTILRRDCRDGRSGCVAGFGRRPTRLITNSLSGLRECEVSELPSRQNGERIARRLSRAGVASRREAEKLVTAGRVRIDGKLCESPATRVDAESIVEVDGAPIPDIEPVSLWRYHKPAGLLVSRTDPRGRRTIYQELPTNLRDAMPVGRLDFASEGLLLLTNDGALKRCLELPRNGFVRRYRARVRGCPRDEELESLRQGLAIRGERFRPMRVVIERTGKSNAWIRLEIREGRYREVRRALDFVGYPVGRLMRVGFGPFALGQLGRGESARVSRKELRAVVRRELPAGGFVPVASG